MAQGQTATARNEKVIKKLNELIHLDYDAIEAYEAAIARLEDTTARAKLQEFMQDHVRHTENLSKLVRQHGGKAANKGDIKRVLTKGKVVIGNIAGDNGILKAMKTNEDETNEKYEKALQMEGLDAATRHTLQQNLDDERRHRQWIISRIDGKR